MFELVMSDVVSTTKSDMISDVVLLMLWQNKLLVIAVTLLVGVDPSSESELLS